MIDDLVIDARGTLCPEPVLRAARVARTLSAGTRLVVLADDPAAATDLPAWARLRGHRVVSIRTPRPPDAGRDIVVTVELGAGRSTSGQPD